MPLCGVLRDVRQLFARQDTVNVTDAVKWLRDVRGQLTRLCHNHKVEHGEELNNSPTPLYLEGVKRMNAAYARAGSNVKIAAQMSQRKFILGTGWKASGRAGEGAYLTFENLGYDSHFNCGVIVIGQRIRCWSRVRNSSIELDLAVHGL